MRMICKIEFKTFDPSWKSLSEEAYAEIRNVVGDSMPENKPEWDGNYYMADLSELQPLLSKYGLSVELKPLRNNYMVSLKDTIKRLELDFKMLKQDLDVNGALVQVHVPNIGLIAMNEVQVLEDACTDRLQRELDEGWSLLAVCPPNAQRRPDYVLGRHNKEKCRK